MIILIAALLITGLVGVVVWAGRGLERNTGPALGNNRPYPDGYGLGGSDDDEPPYYSAGVISDNEQFRRDAHQRLAALEGRPRRATAMSWMDKPGAMESDGLVDRDAAAPPPHPGRGR